MTLREAFIAMRVPGAAEAWIKGNADPLALAFGNALSVRMGFLFDCIRRGMTDREASALLKWESVP